MPIRNPWARPPAPPEALTAALGDLDRLMAARPELSAPGRTLARVLRAAFGREPTETPFDPGADGFLAARIAAAWAEGATAVRVVPPPLDRPSLTARGLAIAEAIRPDNPAAEALRTVLARDPSRFPDWAVWNLSGQAEAYADDVGRLGLDRALASSVLRLALLPALARWSAPLAARLLEGLGDRGDCPICGEPALLAEARGLEQRRSLRCGLCASAWPGDRLRCPSCGETDPTRLGYRYVEGEEGRHRLAGCSACGHRLTVVSTLAPLSAPGLLVTELATVHLTLMDDPS